MVAKRLAHNRKTPEEFYEELEAKHGDRFELLDQYMSASNKIKIKCNWCGTIDYKYPSNLLRGSCGGCYKKTRIKSLSVFLDQVREIHGDKIQYIEGYVNSRSRIKLKCNICSNVWQTNPGSIINGKHGCPKCANTRTTPAEFEAKIKELYGNKFELLTPFISTDKKVKVKCNDCGDITKRFAKEVIKGRCQSCYTLAQIKDVDIFLKELKEIHDDKISYIEGYQTGGSRVKLKCNICGHLWKTLATHLVNGKKTGCPKCASIETANKNRKTHSKFVEDIYSIHREDIEVIGTYKNIKSKVGVRCNCCSHEWEAMPSDLQKGTGCPKCKKSKGEKYILNLLTDNDIDFIPQYWFSDCRNIKPLPFDFAIFKDNKLLFLIEYQGEQHFRMVDFMGGEQGFKQRTERDQIKREYCKSNNILLLEIPYTMSDLEISETILSTFGGM